MADLKISALTGASTPLAGTEVLPIVQGGATVKVAVSDLTAGRAVSAASFAGALNGTVGATTPAAGTFTSATVNSDTYMLKFFAANGTTARGYLYTDGTDIQLDTQNISTPFTILNGGYATFRVDYSNVTLYHSNLVIGTSGKGIDFSADGNAAGMTSELLDDYEEGTFTATLTSATPPTTPITSTGYYTKIGDLVTVTVSFRDVNNTGAAGAISITGLPFAANAAIYSNGLAWLGRATITNGLVSYITPSSTTMTLVDFNGNAVSWASVGAGVYSGFQMTYKV